ncbi:YggS family pyridoxal phosphate-dependent enzyme [Conyzicola nivalis]|uniref:Pyridoxal phosphate homeostasis protein n=1 Tax=Conyzicola nivalis TaxID=1477021 RepID=A0A916WFD8_9MICO|nr:YggS family pyridoxal phosphate-dependent enzyme [Conyzicola nivalis]GGA94155.1 YggS family pyridoxal phosphate enzyme [Conyzicola nivalis]
MQSTPSLADRLALVRSAVADAVREAGRAESEVTTIVVTKFHPASLVRELAALGVTDVGENRQQEASEKAAELADLDLAWHFIGQLQSKKTRAVLAFASAIHSLDRPSLVTALGNALEPGASVDAFIQLNLTDDPARGGVRPVDLEPLAESVLATDGIRMRGLMAVAPLDSDPRAQFARVRKLGERVQRMAPDATDLSMGMSGDYRAAILEGATHLRIGTAITGNRPVAG